MISFIAVLIGYLCGSIPFGLLLTRAAGLGDVRSIGSGNIGATNVLRTGNKKIAALTLFLDGLKGAVPVLLLTHFGGPQAGMIAGLAAMAGHIFPVWLDFKGGKGVATSLGVLFGLFWPLGLIFIALWLALAFAFRMSSRCRDLPRQRLRRCGPISLDAAMNLYFRQLSLPLSFGSCTAPTSED